MPRREPEWLPMRTVRTSDRWDSLGVISLLDVLGIQPRRDCCAVSHEPGELGGAERPGGGRHPFSTGRPDRGAEGGSVPSVCRSFLVTVEARFYGGSDNAQGRAEARGILQERLVARFGPLARLG